jgi:two-component system sensor histidine kinase/response regulator
MKLNTENGNGADILIVDDTPANLQFLASLLKMKGHKTRAALNGELALQAIRNQSPDLILLDVNMPDINGIELCRRLKAEPATANIPIIFVSGEHEVNNKVKAFAAGGVDYITRPFQIDEVLSRVSIHLDLRKQRERLRHILRRMQELEQLRDNLIHLIIHDLRNPLWNIGSYLELIKAAEATQNSPEVATYLRDAQAQTNYMIDLINSILDINKMESRSLELHRTECDLVDLCLQVIENVEPLRQSRILTLESAGPATAMISVSLVRRLLTNLVTAAIKATRNEGGRITVSTQQINGVIRINVTDNAPPIPAGEYPFVFSKLDQAHSALNGKGRYSPGLGLPFCKLAAEAHGGRVGIEAAPEAGNVFWVELPLPAHTGKSEEF